MLAENQKVPLFSRPWFVGLEIGLFLLFFYWSFSFVQSPRENLRILECQGNLKQISLALSCYVDAYHQFPPACLKDEEGNPLYSWRAAILPFLESSPLVEKFHFDEAWNSPHNKKHRVDNPIFSCPSCDNQYSGTTNYVLVTGPGTIWEEGKTYSPTDMPHPEQVLILVEVPDPDIHWTEPGDLAYDDINSCFFDEEGHFKTNHHDFINAAFADGHIEQIPKEEVLTAMKTRSRVNQDFPEKK